MKEMRIERPSHGLAVPLVGDTVPAVLEPPQRPARTAVPPPEIRIAEGRYEVRFARTEEEFDAVLRLRFEVFNLELGEGLVSSFETGRDEDAFDASCHHLMVVERETGEVVGTYRLQTSAMAQAGSGFYSAGEFDLSSLPVGVLEDAVELGRACIAKPHRNTRVLFLLWRGLAAYVVAASKRFLFGCCSLTSQDCDEGWRVANHLRREGHYDDVYVVEPVASFACRASRVAPADATPVKVPALFGTYLRFGARVCSGPAIDRSFGTIDFFVLFDVTRMDERTLRMFFEVQ